MMNSACGKGAEREANAEAALDAAMENCWDTDPIDRG